MDAAFAAINRQIRNGDTPDPALGAHWRRPWDREREEMSRGISANHGLIGWYLSLAQPDVAHSDPARDYFIERCRHELRESIALTEQHSPTYYGIHLGMWTLVWWTAWTRRDRELGSLAGGWLERALLMESLLCVREGGRFRPLGPGMRADVRSVTAGRKVEGAIVRLLLTGDHQLELTPASGYWHFLLQAVYGLKNVDRVADRVRRECLALIRDKTKPIPEPLRRCALLVPMDWEAYGRDAWSARIDRGAHGQDPAHMAVRCEGNRQEFAWPFEGRDPRETGWRSELTETRTAGGGARDLHFSWWNRGNLDSSTTIHLPPESRIVRSLRVHEPDGDPLSDLPPLPGEAPEPAGPPGPGRPTRPDGPNGPDGPGGSVEPESPVDVPWDLEELRRDLIRIRENEGLPTLPRWANVTAHRALATLDRLGTWEDPDGGD
jgi:hypothetical protein